MVFAFNRYVQNTAGSHFGGGATTALHLGASSLDTDYRQAMNKLQAATNYVTFR